MKKFRSLICVLLLLSMLASMLFTVNAAKDPNGAERTGISIETVSAENGVKHPEGYYFSGKKLEEIPSTYEAWVYMPSSKSYEREGNVILSNIPHIYAVGTDNWFSFELKNGCEPKLMFGVNNKDVKEVVFWEGGRVPKDSWTHLVLVHDSSAKTVSCYINGELRETKAFDFVPDQSNIDNLLFLAGDGYSANRRVFPGILGDVAVYSDARNIAEVKSDFKNGADVNDEKLLLYYQLSAENDGKDAPDLSGNGYDMNYYRMMITEQEMEEIRQKDEKEYAYSIAFIPDTQYITDRYPQKLAPIFDYILKNKDEKNIKYVVGLGDMTDRNTQVEWDKVKAQYDRFNGVIPYTLIRGNHDGRGADTKFDSIFAQSTSSYYKHIAENGGFYQQFSVKNTYVLFEENGIKYMLLNLDYGLTENVLDWADKVISEHPEHRVIITTHAWLNIDAEPYSAGDWASPSSEVPGSINPDKIWEDHFKKHANIDMIVCGHTNSDQILVTPVTGDNGNTVYQMLIDGQYADISVFQGLGLVGIMHFTEDGRFAKVEYYSTAYDRYYYEGHTDISLDFGANVTKADIGGKVGLTGRDMTEGEFAFLLKPANGEFVVDSNAEPVRAVNAADGSFVFKDVTFENAGKYYFVLSADTASDVENVTVDESVYHVTVEVTGDGSAPEIVIVKKGSTQAVSEIAFENVYKENAGEENENKNENENENKENENKNENKNTDKPVNYTVILIVVAAVAVIGIIFVILVFVKKKK